MQFHSSIIIISSPLKKIRNDINNECIDDLYDYYRELLDWYNNFNEEDSYFLYETFVEYSDAIKKAQTIGVLITTIQEARIDLFETFKAKISQIVEDLYLSYCEIVIDIDSLNILYSDAVGNINDVTIDDVDQLYYIWFDFWDTCSSLEKDDFKHYRFDVRYEIMNDYNIMLLTANSECIPMMEAILNDALTMLDAATNLEEIDEAYAYFEPCIYYFYQIDDNLEYLLYYKYKHYKENVDTEITYLLHRVIDFNYVEAGIFDYYIYKLTYFVYEEKSVSQIRVTIGEMLDEIASHDWHLNVDNNIEYFTPELYLELLGYFYEYMKLECYGENDVTLNKYQEIQERIINAPDVFALIKTFILGKEELFDVFHGIQKRAYYLTNMEEKYDYFLKIIESSLIESFTAQYELYRDEMINNVNVVTLNYIYSDFIAYCDNLVIDELKRLKYDRLLDLKEYIESCSKMVTEESLENMLSILELYVPQISIAEDTDTVWAKYSDAMNLLELAFFKSEDFARLENYSITISKKMEFFVDMVNGFEDYSLGDYEELTDYYIDLIPDSSTIEEIDNLYEEWLNAFKEMGIIFNYKDYHENSTDNWISVIWDEYDALSLVCDEIPDEITTEVQNVVDIIGQSFDYFEIFESYLNIRELINEVYVEATKEEIIESYYNDYEEFKAEVNEKDYDKFDKIFNDLIFNLEMSINQLHIEMADLIFNNAYSNITR